MGFIITNTPSAEAPKGIEPGLCAARFDGLSQQSHPDWKTPNGKFGPDDGERLHWAFTLTDDKGEVLYDEGDAIEVEAVNGTNLNTKSEKSRNALWLKNLSPKAFAIVDAGQPFDPSELVGLPCTLLLEVKENGWPKVLNVLPARKAR